MPETVKVRNTSGEYTPSRKENDKEGEDNRPTEREEAGEMPPPEQNKQNEELGNYKNPKRKNSRDPSRDNIRNGSRRSSVERGKRKDRDRDDKRWREGSAEDRYREGRHREYKH